MSEVVPKTQIGEISVTKGGNLVITCNLQLLTGYLKRAVASPIEALWEDDIADIPIATSSGSPGLKNEPQADQGSSNEPQNKPPSLPMQGTADQKKESQSPDDSGNPGPAEPRQPGIDLFEPSPQNPAIRGELQELKNGREMINEIRSWLKANNFNYKNFCRYLFSLYSIGGHQLRAPLIGKTTQGDPSLFKVAARYYTYWKGHQDEIKSEYENFVSAQIKDLGYTVEMAKEILGGTEVDPTTLEPRE